MSDKESLNNSENTVAESTPWDTLAEDAGTEAPAETMEESPLGADLETPETPETPTPTPTYREVAPAQISEEQKDVVLRGMVNREQSSNRRIENAIKKNLSLEEQDKILDSEIKLQESQEALLNDMTSENETNQSFNGKVNEASRAMRNASDTYLSTIKKE